MLFLDGVYIDSADRSRARLRWIKAPTSDELIQLTHTIAQRVGRYLERQGLLVRDAGNSYLTAEGVDADSESPINQLLGSSITSAIAPALFYLRPSMGSYLLHGPGQPLDRSPVSPSPCIFHRVLESSDGMEVIEVGCPAEHETRVDHEMVLPTTTVNRKRQFDAQQFVHHRVSGATWLSGPSNCFETRDTGIGRATANLAAAVVLRSTGRDPSQVLCHRAEFLFNFVLRGSMSLRVPAENGFLLKADDCFVIPPDTRFVLSNISADLQLLQVTLPGV